MADYDKSWGRIDELAIVPGGTARTPFDVWLEHRLAANLRKITEGVEVIACHMIGGTRDPADPPAGTSPYPGDLAWASKSWSAPVVVPILLTQGATKIKMHAWCAVRGGGAMHWRLDMTSDVEGGDIVESASGSFSSQIMDGSFATAELEFDAPKASTRWVILRFWIRSQVVSETSSQNATTAAEPTRIISSSVSLGGWDARPSDGTLDIRSVVGLDASGGLIGDVDILAVDSPGNDLIVSGNATGIARIKFENLSVMQPRALAIEVIHDEASAGAPPRVGLIAQEPVRGRLAMRNAYGRQRVWQRARLAAWGPGGFVDTVGAEGEPQRRRWDFSMGDSTVAASVTDAKIADSTLHIRRDDARLVIGLMLVSIYHSDLNAEEQPGQDSKRTRIDEDGEITWTIAASVERDGTALVSNSDDVVVPTYSARRSLRPIYEDASTPFLSQRNYEVFETGTSTARAQREWALREGQLFPSDIGLLSFVEIDLDVSGVSDISEHVRMLVTAEFEGANFDATLARAEIVCVGWSATLEVD